MRAFKYACFQKLLLEGSLMRCSVIKKVDDTNYTLYEGDDESYAHKLTVHLIEEYAEELMFDRANLNEKKAIQIAEQRFSVMVVKNKKFKMEY